MKLSNFDFYKKSYFKIMLFIFITFYISTLLNQDKYYSQLSESRENHYKDVVYLLQQMNKECLLKYSETVCLDHFKSIVSKYSNHGTISLYDSSNQLVFQKKDESIYDHRQPVVVSHTFTEFGRNSLTMEISKLTSYPNIWVNALNAMTLSSWNYIEDILSRINGKEPAIKGMTWGEFFQRIAWNRFYPSMPFVIILLLVAFYGLWRRQQTEKINLKLVHEQQKLNQDRDSLHIAINDLKAKVESSEYQHSLLIKNINKLEEKIKNTVDKSEIDKLIIEKSALEKEVKNNVVDKQQVIEELSKKDQEQKELQARIAEYELKSGFTLVGEFVRQWTFFESQLHRLCSVPLQQRILSKSSQGTSVELIEDLYNQAIINKKTYDELFHVRKFRNNLMHVSKVNDDKYYQNITHDLKKHIQTLDNLNIKLQAQEVY